MPATWDMYGVDANGDGQKDPFNPVDAIFAAARYLRAAGADKDLYRAIFAYNHADWYVESVLMRARVIGGLPTDLVGSLTGLTQGRFPVGAKSTYAGALPDSETRQALRARPERRARRRVGRHAPHIRIFSRQGAPVVAVKDGRITRLGHSRRLGNFVELQDTYGNTYLYSGLGEIAKTYPFPRERKARGGELALPEAGRRRRARPRGRRSPRSRSGTARSRVRARRRTARRPAARRRRTPSTTRRHRSRSGSPPRSRRPTCPRPRPRRSASSPTRAGPTVRRVMRTLESAAAPSPGLSDETADHGRPAARPARLRRQAAQAAAPASPAGPCSASIGRTSDELGAEPPVRDPPRRPRRPADRPEADPRRLEAARVDRDLPLGQAQPVLRRRRRGALDRPDHADEQGGAPAPRAPQPEHRHLRAAAARTSRPARSTAACWRRSSSSPPRA